MKPKQTLYPSLAAEYKFEPSEIYIEDNQPVFHGCQVTHIPTGIMATSSANARLAMNRHMALSTLRKRVSGAGE